MVVAATKSAAIADRPKYNHDIDMAPSFADVFPSIKNALHWDALIETFHQYDRLAKHYKRTYRLIGMSALALGAIAIVAAPWLLVMTKSPLVSAISLVVDAFGVLSVILIVVNMACRFRRKWCWNVMIRERIRQFQFQLFMDGPLIELAGKDPNAFVAQRNAKWEKFLQEVRNPAGALPDFVEGKHMRNPVIASPKFYTDPVIAAEVWEAMEILRFQHQLQFTAMKLGPGGEAMLSMGEKRDIAETIAKMTLFGAVLCTTAFFVIDVIPYTGFGANVSQPLLEKLPPILTNVILVLTGLSAASRAYRSGETIPGEQESYDLYQSHIAQLKLLFRNAKNDNDKLAVLSQVEHEAEEELRRFLSMKIKASFIM